MEFIIKSFTDTDNAAKKILENSTYKIFTLEGNLGAGKTTLIKSFAKALSCVDEVSSPTFSIVNEYLLPNGKKIYHFDLYRIKDIEELFTIGFYEYIDSGNYCFIEWAKISESELPEHHKISLNLENDIINLIFI